MLSSIINWFSFFISLKLGNKRSLDFWRRHWLGSSSLGVLFPSLFRLSFPGVLKVGDAGVWINDSWEWDLGFNVAVMSTKDALLLDDLLKILYEVKPKSLKEDSFVWWRDKMVLQSKIATRGFLSRTVRFLIWIL